MQLGPLPRHRIDDVALLATEDWAGTPYYASFYGTTKQASLDSRNVFAIAHVHEIVLRVAELGHTAVCIA